MKKPYCKTRNATIYHGNSLDIIFSLADAGVLAVVTDPPYSSGGAFRMDRNQPVTSKYVRGGTKRKLPSFHGDHMDGRAYLSWSCGWMRKVFDILPDGGMLMCFTDWRQLPTISDAVQMSGFVWRSVVPWDKTEGCRPVKGLFRSQCEYVLVATKGPFKQLVDKCAAGVVREHVHAASKQHIAQKPVKVMEHLLSVLPEGCTVFDPFMGAGSTGVAAVKNKMKFVGCEMAREFCDISIERIRAAEV